jgi:hypothetical protein
VAFIAALASTVLEVNQIPPWIRYTRGQQEVREDQGLAEPAVVRLHHGCARTPSSPSWPEISFTFICMHGDPSDAGAGFLFVTITV